MNAQINFSKHVRFHTYADRYQSAYVFNVKFQDGSEISLPITNDRKGAFSGEFSENDKKSAEGRAIEEVETFENNRLAYIVGIIRKGGAHETPVRLVSDRRTIASVEKTGAGYIFDYNNFGRHSDFDRQETVQFRNVAELYASDNASEFVAEVMRNAPKLTVKSSFVSELF